MQKYKDIYWCRESSENTASVVFIKEISDKRITGRVYNKNYPNGLSRDSSNAWVNFLTPEFKKVTEINPTIKRLVKSPLDMLVIKNYIARQS